MAIPARPRVDRPHGLAPGLGGDDCDARPGPTRRPHRATRRCVSAPRARRGATGRGAPRPPSSPIGIQGPPRDVTWRLERAGSDPCAFAEGLTGPSPPRDPRKEPFRGPPTSASRPTRFRTLSGPPAPLPGLPSRRARRRPRGRLDHGLLCPHVGRGTHTEADAGKQRRVKTPGELPRDGTSRAVRRAEEPIAARRMIDPARDGHGVPPRMLAADTGHVSCHVLARLEGQGIEAHVPPMASRDGTGKRPPKAAFTSDPRSDACPEADARGPSPRGGQRRALSPPAPRHPPAETNGFLRRTPRPGDRGRTRERHAGPGRRRAAWAGPASCPATRRSPEPVRRAARAGRGGRRGSALRPSGAPPRARP